MVLQFSERFKCFLFLLVIHNCSGNLVNITGILDGEFINEKSMLYSKLSSNCRNQSKEFIQGILHFEPWALRMIDASAKVPSGLLDGNVDFMSGSYDECKAINVQVQDNSTSSSIQGKYCKVALHFVMPNIQNSTKINKSMSEEQDIVEKMSQADIAMYIGMCIPNGCTDDDVQSVLNIVNSILPFPAKAKLDTCLDEHKKLDTSAIAVITLWALIAASIIVGTVIDVAPQLRRWWIRVASHSEVSLADRQDQIGSPTNAIHQFFIALSLYSNGKLLFNMNEPNERVTILNGLRFLSIAWIVLGHTILFPFAITYFTDNHFKILEMTKHLAAQVFMGGGNGVDTFYFISGFLLCYVKFQQIRKRGNVNNIQLCILRYWRLLPPLAMAIAWTAVLAPLISSGPHSNLVIDEANKCRHYWWRNILLINNYFDTNNACLLVTWYVAIDFQLFLFSPLVLYPLYKRPKIGYIVIAIATAACITATGVASYKSRTLGELIDKTYYQAYPRAPAYMVGILAGYMLQKPGLEIKLKPITICCGWVLATIISLCVVFGPANGLDYIEAFEVAVTIRAQLLQTFGRFAWALALAWITIACTRGYGGIVNDILSWSFWTPLSRLTYCIYLLHTAVFANFISTRQNKFHFDGLLYIYLFLSTMTMSILVAIPFALAFELPSAALAKILFQTNRKRGALKHINKVASSQQVQVKSDLKNENNDLPVKFKI